MSLLSTTLNVSLTTGESNTFGNVTVANETFNHQPGSVSNPLSNGTSLVAAQANHAQQVVGNATTGGVTIDLTSLAGGLDGATRDWSHGNSGGAIKSMIIENMDSTHTITITLPGSNGWTGFSGEATAYTRSIGPGGHIEFWEPIAGRAVSSTNKSFILTSDAATPQYKISIVGVAA